ncbi:ArsR/SmtB family transcription factor [Jeotgalibaca sp. A122]|uniref:ArsR/SmtB family transcription factor n=1 Tax=Jeotgalibaca sp. A122 TaxID=3457322 RepID=UPI003FD20950
MDPDYASYAKVFKVLSDETRLQIMDMLGNEELCACELLEEFSISQPTLSYHMKLLCESGLVDSRKDGSMVKYTVNHEYLDGLKTFFKHLSNKLTV